MTDPLLEVRGLEKHYPVTAGVFNREVGRVRAVDGVSFSLDEGETLGLVGESGCGKSTVASTLVGLEEPTAGQVLFDGADVTTFDEQRRTRFRREASMIFQDPESSFDPRMTVGESVTEPLVVQGITDREYRRELGQALLERVGLTAADYDRYPHEFSGGQRQRVALARALVVRPRLVVADEPVSALDVSVQSDVLSLLAALQAEFGLALLLISHDLSVVREVCDRVAVMYLGELVEVGPTETLFADPKHPYTRALVSAIPDPDPTSERDAVELTGTVPDAADPPPGCRFHTRCPAVIQPSGVALEQAVWRRLLDARDAIATGAVDVAAVRELAADGDDTAAALRDEFDLPARLSDPTVETTLQEALETLAGGDHDAAAERLADVVETPCERVEPSREPVRSHGERTVACHLHHPPEGVDVDDERTAPTDGPGE